MRVMVLRAAAPLALSLSLAVPSLALGAQDWPEFPPGGEPPGLAVELYRSVLNGPHRRSEVNARYTARLPDVVPECPEGMPQLWTWPACRPSPRFGSDGAQSATGQPVTARTGRIPYVDARNCASVNLLFDGCQTTAGAAAEAEFGRIRAHAEARGGFSTTRRLPDTSTPDEFDEVEATYRFDPTARAEGQWSTEIRSGFTGYVEARFGVEMHERRINNPILPEQLDLGSGSLEFGLFRKPPNLVPPPQCPGGWGVDACGTGWTFYGTMWEEEQYNSAYWGWDWVAGGDLRLETIGVTPYTFGFDVEAGAEYAFVMRFTARASGNEYADFWGTASLDYFEVPEAGDLSFAAGAFEVRRRGGGPTPVPEPTTIALLLLGGVGICTRRSRRCRC